MKNLKFVAAGMIGNMLEWYDFALFGLLAPVFSQLFFPNENKCLGLLASFAIFAVGYFMRPIGGLLAGHFGDRYSRKTMLIVTIMTMGVSTGLVGLIPTYYEVGVMAAIILVGLRLIQGIAVGGEFPGSMVVVYESLPAYRGTCIALLITGAMLGIYGATFVVHSLQSHYGQSAFNAWAWRLPFLMGVALAVLGLYLRLQLLQSNEKPEKAPHNLPVAILFKKHAKALLTGLGYLSIGDVYASFFSIFLTSYLVHSLNFSYHQATEVAMWVGVVMLVTVLIVSVMADYFRQGRRFVQWGLFVALISTYPLFKLMTFGYVYAVFSLMMLLVIYAFVVSGQIYTMLSSLFKKRIRYTGVALSHSISAGAFIGVTPMLNTWLMYHFGSVAVCGMFYVCLFILMASLIWGEQEPPSISLKHSKKRSGELLPVKVFSGRK